MSCTSTVEREHGEDGERVVEGRVVQRRGPGLADTLSVGRHMMVVGEVENGQEGAQESRRTPRTQRPLQKCR